MIKLTDKFNNYIKGCIKNPISQNQHLSGTGATYEFEEKLIKYYSKKHAVTFSNCTTAMLTLYHSLNFKNKEVITTPLNWGGSISPIIFSGSKIIFSSIDQKSLNLNPSDLVNSLSSKTKAVLSVDYNGIPADSKQIKEFCKSNNLYYISDSAQSFGAFRDQRPAGYFADFIVLSFGPGKSLFGGEGGAILTDNEEIYEKIIWFSQHPYRQKSTFGPDTYNEYLPFNGRLNPLSAIMLNNLFYVYLKRIKTKQVKTFELLNLLRKNKFIHLPKQIAQYNNSAYFKLQYLLFKSIKIEDINDFLKNNNFNFQATQYKPNLIPLDKSFVRQFKNKYHSNKSYLKNLLHFDYISLNETTNDNFLID